MGFPGGSVVKNPPTNSGASRDVGSIPGSRRSPGIGNGNPFQYSCQDNPMDRSLAGLRRVRHNWVTEHVYTHTRARAHNPHAWYPYKKKDLDAEICREERWMEDLGRTSHEDEGRDWGDAQARKAREGRAEHLAYHFTNTSIVDF